MPKTISGVSWVSKFPTSTSTNDLVEPFRSNVNKFLAALKAAGATVTIAATLRPKERAYLMHWSFKIARLAVDPATVPPMIGVDIEWVHPAAKTAAEAMVVAYEIAFAPALTSRHIEGKAIDMDVSWKTPSLAIKDAAGQTVTITSTVKNGNNTDLHKVGATYSVFKLASDPPHWSFDGH